MQVVDTSAWIEAMDNTTALGKMIAAEMPAPADWLVPTVVQLELAKWARRELEEDETQHLIAFTSICHVADLDSEIALAAAAFSALYRLSTADAIIYATALAYGADLLTCDAHFKDLPGVRYISKAMQ
jgi:predicted nucleic acid-binding protein